MVIVLSDSTRASLSVSLVAYKQSGEVLRQTLVHLDKALAQADLPLVSTVHLVDNTEDGRWQTLAETFSSKIRPLEYLSLSDNPGYACGHNRVLLNVDTDYHLILNPDLYLHASALQQGLSYLQRDSAAVLVCPRVLDEQGKELFLQKRYPSVRVLALRGFAPHFIRKLFANCLAEYEMRDLPRDQINDTDVEICSGCCMLLKTAKAKAIGGFDEQFFLYFEDFDFCLRLKQSGKLVYLPQMLATHLGGYTSSKGLRHIGLFMTSARRFFSKHGWQW